MARKPTNVTATSNDEEKILDVAENTDTSVAVDTEEKTAKKPKEIKDDEKVSIKNKGCANRKIYTTDINNPIVFDKDGIAEVIGKEAKRLLTIPGYERA